MKHSKYTFLIPAWKSDYLEKALRSIASQTYKYFHVIISDDCSPYNILSLCKPFLADKRFEYRRNETNIGGKDLVKHWNLLLNLCETDYLIMAGDDDVYSHDFLEKIDMKTQCYPNCDLIRSRVRIINSQGTIIGRECLYEEHVSQLGFIAQSYINVNVKCIGNYVFKTSALKAVGGFVYFPMAWSSDTATAIKMSVNGCVNLSDECFFFRRSEINISSKTANKEEALLKVNGILLFDSWLKELIANIKAKDDYECQLKQFIVESQRKSAEMMVCYEICNCTIKQWICTIRQAKKHGLESAYIIVYYIKKKIYNLFRLILP